MNHLMQDWNFESDVALTNHNIRQDYNELVELLWRNGQLVLNTQSRRPTTLIDVDEQPLKSGTSRSILIQDDNDHETVSWVHHDPLRDSFDSSDLFSELVSSGPIQTENKPFRQPAHQKFVQFPPVSDSNLAVPKFTSNPMHPPGFPGSSNGEYAAKGSINFPPIRGENAAELSATMVGSSHCGSNQLLTDLDFSRACASSNGTVGPSARPLNEPMISDSDRFKTERTLTSSSGGSGSSLDRTCKHLNKRKNIDIEESDQCQSDDVAELESSRGNKPVQRSGSARKSRAAEVHNLSERRRRDRINKKMKALQELIPHCNKADKASMLDEAIEYLKSLQFQLQIMWMGSGMGPMMFPGMHRYMSCMGMPPVNNPMQLQSMAMAPPQNQPGMSQNPVYPVNYQNQMQNTNFSNQYAARYMGFHSMQPSSQPGTVFGFGSQTMQQDQIAGATATSNALSSEKTG